MDEKVIELGVDLQCKYMIFMPEFFRHTSWIYLESLAGVSMLQGRPQLFTTLEGPALVWDQSRGECVCVSWYKIGSTPQESEVSPFIVRV